MLDRQAGYTVALLIGDSHEALAFEPSVLPYPLAQLGEVDLVLLHAQAIGCLVIPLGRVEPLAQTDQPALVAVVHLVVVLEH